MVLDIHLGDTYGALFIGLLISAVLFGITNLQVFVYFQSYKNDRIWSKLAVCWLWLLDAFHLALISHAVYFYLVSNYANPLKLTHVVWSFHLQLVVDMLTIVTVQALYSHRLWKLSRIEKRKGIMTKIVPFIVSLLVLAAVGICVVVSKLLYAIHDFTQMDLIKWATFMALITASVVDVIIAISLCFTLAKLRTGFSKTDSMINQLMLFVLNTGVLTSLCSITAVSLYGAYPHNFIFLAVEFLMTKLYVNAFLAMFNARHRLQAAMDHTTIDLGAFSAGPIAIKIDERSNAKKQKEGAAAPSKPGVFGSLVFSHSIVESEDSRSTNGGDSDSDNTGKTTGKHCIGSEAV